MHHLSKDVRAELRYVLIGEIVCSALICVVFALLHRLDYTVPLGAVWGSFFALLNLYLLARRVQRISDSGEADKAAAQKQLKASYLGRIMIMAFAVVTGVLIPWFHYIAVLVPFLAPQPIMMIRRAVRSARARRDDTEKKGGILMEVDIHGAPVYFEIPILGGIPITASMVGTWCVMLVLTLLCVWLTHDLKVRNISKRQAVAEKIVMMAENFVRANMGEQWMDMVPMIAALFSLSLGSSLLSLLGLWAPTADVSVLLGWALIVFMLITYYKIKTNGFLGYLKGFCDPVFPMAPFNVLGEVFKPISMSFRHFGNVLSGYVISSLVYAALILANHALFGLLPGVVGDVLGNIPFLAVGVPAVLSLYFDWFSSFMQAFIFCMLTMIFIRTAAE